MPAEGYHEIVGVIHIHSNYSDGSKSIVDIAKIGEAAGLDYLMFSDHMTLQPLRDGLDRFHGKVAVIIGYEIEDARNENHFLAFGLKKELPFELSAQEYVAAVKKEGGLGIIAHPDEIRNAIPEYPSYPWTSWGADAFDAIEIWNHMSAWMELLKKINFLKLIFTPRSGLRGPTGRVLAKWDEISLRRKLAGIGSADVHAHAYRKGPLKVTIFPYKVQFRSIRTHIILDRPFSSDFTVAKQQILDAIRNCRAFVSNFRWGDARGFRFLADDGSRIYQPGDDIELGDNLHIRLTAPLPSSIRLIRNGRVAKQFVGNGFDFKVDLTGFYRVELFRQNRGWIYSNHLRIYKKG